MGVRASGVKVELYKCVGERRVSATMFLEALNAYEFYLFIKNYHLKINILYVLLFQVHVLIEMEDHEKMDDMIYTLPLIKEMGSHIFVKVKTLSLA